MGKRRFTYGQATDKGVRESNEDAALSLVLSDATAFGDEDIGLFIVGDGMGGIDSGDNISRSITGTILQEVMRELLQRKSVYQEPPYIEVMENAFHHARKLINEQTSISRISATAALLINDIVFICHSGNTRAYFIFEDSIDQITPLELEEIKSLIKKPDINSDANSNTFALMNIRPRSQDITWETYVPTFTYRMTQPSPILLLCTKGLYDYILDERVKEAIRSYSSDLQTACEHIIALANANGGDDNITAILIKMND